MKVNSKGFYTNAKKKKKKKKKKNLHFNKLANEISPLKKKKPRLTNTHTKTFR